MRYGGDEHLIESGPYTAVVTEVGATVRMLRWRDRDLVAGFAPDRLRPVYRGAVLAPWPNRIVDGRYAFGGQRHQLPLTEPARGHAIHGLVSWAAWRLSHRAADEVVWEHRVVPQDGYPFQVDLRVRYAVAADGLTWQVSAVNTGDVPAPYGCAPHPYLTPGDGRVDDWFLELPAERYVRATEDRLIPLEVTGTAGTDFNFRTPRRLGAAAIDHAFTGIGFDSRGTAAARVLTASGDGVRIAWDASCPWVQIHTADRPEPDLHRAGLAVEPMTCPPDAFNSGTDVVVLQPEDRHESSWTISAVTGSGPPA